jgi:hypothetical protein
MGREKEKPRNKSDTDRILLPSPPKHETKNDVELATKLSHSAGTVWWSDSRSNFTYKQVINVLG